MSEKESFVSACCAVVGNKRCISSKGLKRLKADDILFWCHEHYEKFRSKTDLDKTFEERHEMFKRLIKESGVTGAQFFREYYGYEFKDAAKNLAGVKQ